ncbi:LOW QUALITY PROTEIN: probable E3 ubiquitin-protein ligase RHY1A [Gastrolobium bilobum]|uniref:LOW QUALITY PROTEIN: probable E3 ubiquitin-protein ligase RHY1A n=1 Tax=Gastrolobium bilobum TaxID=150636 RepID=UPI002AB2FCED|nr:LOW QUALITY PROTEIN: probable E3 ubiquitin-protein ligase RHY1A [Gastrolobium bilobum]
MTSASELFHIRRHRLGRNALDLGFDSSSASDLHHHRLHDLDAGDSLRRYYHLRRLRHPERASDRIDGRHRRSLLNDSVDSAENVRGIRGFRASASDRLPVGVVLARARLFQRLRGDPVSRNRQYGRGSMGEDPESEFPTRGSLVTDLTSQMGRSQLLQELKPPGLTQEALNCLHLEVFSSRETELESRVLQIVGYAWNLSRMEMS